MVALPAADWDYDYAAIGREADAIILMNYDDHWLTSPPGPIAPQDWFADNIDSDAEAGSAGKAGDGHRQLRVRLARHEGLAAHETALVGKFRAVGGHGLGIRSAGAIRSDSLNPHYSYSDEHNHIHQVWMLDGVTAYNELRAAERAGVRGTALWRLGTEDPSLWSIWDVTHPRRRSRARLADMPPGYDLILEGDGDIWRITDTPQKGQRTFRFDADEQQHRRGKLRQPAAFLPHRSDGRGAKEDRAQFRRRPGSAEHAANSGYLEGRNRLPATFFVIGSDANDSLGLLQREYDEGHEIGNHTYTHPRVDEISRTQFEVELNLTERLFASTLGVKTLLFRPPYGIDHQPETADEVASLPIPQSMGYLLVGARIDPHDWGEPGGVPPAPAKVIVQRVLEQARQGVGNIVLLHDGGGDRSHTIEALPHIIDGLRAAGFQMVPVSDLIGQTRAQVMLPLDFPRAPAWRAPTR